MVDTEDQREDRKNSPTDDYAETLTDVLGGHTAPEHRPAPVRHQMPSRRERRQIAKRRGVFKTPGLWQHINQRSNPAHRNIDVPPQD